jgi:lipopolysaccharide assembly protein A
MLRLLGFVLLFALVLLGLSFAVLNAGAVEIHYYLGALEVPLSLALVSMLALGVVLGLVVGLGVVLAQKRRIHQLEKKVATTATEIDNLRAIPIKDVR